MITIPYSIEWHPICTIWVNKAMGACPFLAITDDYGNSIALDMQAICHFYTSF